MKNFRISYVDGGVSGEITMKAINRGSARAAFRQKFGSAKVEKMEEIITTAQKVIQKAVTEHVLTFGVQKSLQLGYNDLPLFQENNQTELF